MFGRANGHDKVTKRELWCMQQIKNSKFTDVLGLIGEYLYDISEERRKDRPILGGHYVTILARFFGIDFSRLTRNRDEMKPFGLSFYLSLNYLTYDANRHLEYYVDRPNDSEAGGSGVGRDDEDEAIPDAPGGDQTQFGGSTWAPTQDAWESLVSGFGNLSVGYQSQFDAFRSEQRDHNDRMWGSQQNVEEMARESLHDQQWMAYGLDWQRHNDRLYYHNPDQYYGTTSQTPVYYRDPIRPRVPAPIYNTQEAMEEARRRFEQDYPEGTWPYGGFF